MNHERGVGAEICAGHYAVKNHTFTPIKRLLDPGLLQSRVRLSPATASASRESHRQPAPRAHEPPAALPHELPRGGCVLVIARRRARARAGARCVRPRRRGGPRRASRLGRGDLELAAGVAAALAPRLLLLLLLLGGKAALELEGVPAAPKSSWFAGRTSESKVPAVPTHDVLLGDEDSCHPVLRPLRRDSP